MNLPLGEQFRSITVPAIATPSSPLLTDTRHNKFFRKTDSSPTYLVELREGLEKALPALFAITTNAVPVPTDSFKSDITYFQGN